jgi:hypothetical protein
MERSALLAGFGLTVVETAGVTSLLEGFGSDVVLITEAVL